MTVGQALERAEELRPGSRIARSTRCAWLKEADAMLRQRFFKNSITDAYDEVGRTLPGTTACRTRMYCWHRNPLMQCIRIICAP